MSDRKINTGGLENLLDMAAKNKNVPLCIKLSDILVTEGGKVSKKLFKKLLGLAKRVPDKEAKEVAFACVRLGSTSGHLTPEVLKRCIFPHMDNTWPELTVAQLEDQGLGRTATVTPLIEFLVGQGKAEAAATVAAIFPEHVDARLKFLTATTSSSEDEATAAAAAMAAEQVTAGGDQSQVSTPSSSSPEPLTQSTTPSSANSKTDETLACLVKQMVEDDKISDLGTQYRILSFLFLMFF